MTNEKKEEVSYWFAGFALVSGIGLTVAGFVVPPLGEIHSSILWVLGQCLVFAGMVVGIDLKIKSGLNGIRDSIMDSKHIEEEQPKEEQPK